MKAVGLAVSIAVLMLCGGCQNPPAVASAPESVASIDQATGIPLLQTGEKIKVTVFGENNLSGDYVIDPGGFVSLPLAGTIKASGKTKLVLERELAKKFRGEFLRDPKVTVEVVEFRPFYVLGEVAKPGEYPYRGGINVMSAIAVAGGQTYRASNSTVLVQRAGQTTTRELSLSAGVLIYPGDLIQVPQRYF